MVKRTKNMVTFYEVKNLFSRIICGRNLEEDNDNDINIDCSRFRGLSSSQEDNQITIKNSELQELYDRVLSKKHDNLQLYDDFGYEIAFDFDDYRMRIHNLPITSEDIENGIKYELSEPTSEYCMYLLMLIKEQMNQQEGRFNRIPPMRLRRPADRFWRSDDEITLPIILKRMIGEVSLKIIDTKGNKRFICEYANLKTSFVFDYMYKSRIALVEFLNITDMFPFGMMPSERRPATEISTPPLRCYVEDVVDYYKQALASKDPYIKYISFYHIMEYFFDEVFKRKVVEDFKNKITHPDFSYKDDNKVYDLAQYIKNKFSSKDIPGQGDEKESLKYVLTEYVPIDDLKTRIDAINPTAVTYYQNNKVSFCNASPIGWTDLQGVYTKIRDRVYNTRNSLVHSKSGKNFQRYRPYKDENQLQLEIPLVQAIAELIIINSSKIL